jgi:hypothetical protein
MKFDDSEFHEEESVRLGQTTDDAFTHIGFMLAWLIRHDLVAARYFGESLVEQVKDGSLRPNDLRDAVDGKLLSVMLKPQATRFLEAYYPGGYGEDYASEFADLTTYGVPDDSATENRIDRRIGAAWERWQRAGRPGPEDERAIWRQPSIGDVLPAAARPANRSERSEPKGGRRRQAPEPMLHRDPMLEGMIKRVAGSGLHIQSRDARVWGSSLLARVLRNLSVAQSDAIVATGMGSQPTDPKVEIYRVPGVDRTRLAAEFQIYFSERSRRWNERPLGSRTVRRATSRIRSLPDYHMIWFAVDGFVIHLVSPEKPALEAIAVALADELEATGR